MLNLDSEEAHEGYAHEGRQDEGDAYATERTGDVGICGEALTDSCDGSDGEKPAKAPASTCADGSPYAREVALLHEERTAEDGTVDSDEREEDTERGIERGAVFLDGHLDELGHRGNDGDEHDEREEAQVNVGILRAEPSQRTGTQDVGLQKIVDRECHHKHEGHGNAQTEGGLHVLRHGDKGAHAKEVGENHVVDKNRPYEYVEIFHVVQNLIVNNSG